MHNSACNLQPDGHPARLAHTSEPKTAIGRHGKLGGPENLIVIPAVSSRASRPWVDSGNGVLSVERNSSNATSCKRGQARRLYICRHRRAALQRLPLREAPHQSRRRDPQHSPARPHLAAVWGSNAESSPAHAYLRHFRHVWRGYLKSGEPATRTHPTISRSQKRTRCLPKRQIELFRTRFRFCRVAPTFRG